MVDRTGLFVAPLPGATPAGTSPTDGRLVLGGLFGTGAGCISGGALTASATQMQIAVAAAVWRIPDPTNTAGVYLAPADPATFTFSAGPASGSRIDVLWVRQNNYEAGDANSRVVYGVAAGTAASSPTAPAVPAGAIAIGQLTVPAGAANAAACTLVTPYAGQAVAPPPLLVATTAQLPASGAHYGQLAQVAATTIAGATFPATYRWNGASWKPWDSDWVSWYGVWTGLSGSAFASPGWLPGGRFRYTSGKVRLEFGMSIQGSPTNTGTLTVTIPVPADQFGYANGGNTAPLQRKYATHGRAWRWLNASSRDYDFELRWVSATVLAFGQINSAQYLDGAGGNLAQSDEIVGVIEYDPA